MSAWQLYPTVIWLTDRSHTLVLLAMDLPARRVLGATVVQHPQDAGELVRRLVDGHGCQRTLRSIWDPLFEDLITAARHALAEAGCPDAALDLDPDDFLWAIETGNHATRVIRDANPATAEDVAAALAAWTRPHLDRSTAMTADPSTGNLPRDAHPCEGPGSDPQDLLPDDRAWGSGIPPPGRS